MAEVPESKKRANAKYDALHTKFYGLKLNIGTDADIIEMLDAVPNKQAFVKDAIRAYIEKNKTDK